MVHAARFVHMQMLLSSYFEMLADVLLQALSELELLFDKSLKPPAYLASTLTYLKRSHRTVVTILSTVSHQWDQHYFVMCFSICISTYQ